MSIYENVIHAKRIDGETRRSVLDEVVERSPSSAALCGEAKDRFQASALERRGGEQQRLRIARAVVADPCSALDPIPTAKIEELIFSFSGESTVRIVTHNRQRAARVSD